MNTLNWLDCKTGEPILSEEGTAYLLIPQKFGGGHYEVTGYKGDGCFENANVFEKILEWNEPRRATQDPVFNRLIGIDLALGDERNAALKYPIKITKDAEAVYEKVGPSVRDMFDGKSKAPEEICRFYENVEKALFRLSPKNPFFEIKLFNQYGKPATSYEDVECAKAFFYANKDHSLLINTIISEERTKEADLEAEEELKDEEFGLG